MKAAQFPHNIPLMVDVGALYILAFFNQKASFDSSGLGGPYPNFLNALFLFFRLTVIS
jgi:hypothetical protein